MGIHKTTKIYYQHNLEDSAFTGTKRANDDRGFGEWYLGDDHSEDSTSVVYTYTDQATATEVNLPTLRGVATKLHAYHTKGPNVKHAFPESILALKTWASVAEAKAAIFNASSITAFDDHCDQQEWALVDGDKGLKHTRDHKEGANHPADLETKAQVGPSGADDPARTSEDNNDGFMKLPSILVDDSSHLF
jgi:hypothetical protein